MPHRSTGGHGNSGYVYTDLAASPIWENTHYFPAQLLDPQTNPPAAGGNISDYWGSVHVNDLASADLKGGLLRFFVAEWEQITQNWVVYLLRDSITVGRNQWEDSTFFISSDPNDWLKIDGGLQKSLPNILVAPQQYGFGFDDNSIQPTGELGFDTFALSSVPEPSVIFLTLMGIGWFARFTKSRKK